MDLQSLFNLAARKGKASTIFVPQQEQPSYIDTAARQPQRASTVFIPQKQMPSYLDTAASAGSVSPLFVFPKATTKPSQKVKPSVVPDSSVVVSVPAGTVQPTAIVKGLTPAGTVDRSQSDEYKSQMAQYQNLINQKKQEEAEDLGMKIWMEKYGKRPMAQAGGAIGAKNPLLAEFFPETGGYPGTFAPVEEYQMGEFGTRAQGDSGWTMESLNPLQAQAAQQEATAAQADKATTAGASASERAQNLTRAFRLGLI